MHVQTVHEKRRDFACLHCAAALGSAVNLISHVQTVHESFGTSLVHTVPLRLVRRVIW